MRNIFLFLLSTLYCFSSAGQVTTDSLLIEGHYRTFHFKEPVSTKTNISLIFILHGSGGNGLDIMHTATKLEDISDKESLLLVYPDGYKKYWNECRKAADTPPNVENIDENSFFDGMINYFKKRYQIGAKQVFAVGTSGGGHMAYKLAMTMPEKFMAITAIVANLPDSDNMDCIPSKLPVSVMIINGTEDPLNKYNGGEMKIPGAYLGRVRSTEQTFKYWADLAGYKTRPVKKKLPDTDPYDGKTIESYTCKAKHKPEIVLLKVIGGKHDYPNDIDVYLETWKFFKRQILSQ